MPSQDLHQLILRWPHTDANEVIVTGTFDQWSSSLRLTRKPDGFEAPPVFMPWRDKIAYKFIVDGRWMTNDAEPTEVDHGFVNNVYTAPSKPILSEPEPSTAPPSYHSESEVEHEPVEKVSNKLTKNGTALRVIPDTPTPTPDAAPEQRPRVPVNESGAIVRPGVEAVRETVAPAVEAAQAAVAQVAPAPIEVEKAADEITSEPGVSVDAPVPIASERPIQIPVLDLAPNVPIGILPNSTSSDPSNSTPATAQVDSENERSTHVPLRFASGTAFPTLVPQVEEAAPVPESVPEETTPAPVKEEEAPIPAPVEEEPEAPALVERETSEETILTPVEEEGEPEETTPAVVEKSEQSTPLLVEPEVESPKEDALAQAGVEGTEVSAVPEPAPAPPTEPEPALVEEPESAPLQEPEEIVAPASQELAAVPEPPSEPAPEPEPVPEAKVEVSAVHLPAAEATVSPTCVVEPTPVVEVAATQAPATEPTPGVEAEASHTPAAKPTPAVEVAAGKAPVTETTPAAAPEPTPQVVAVNGHSKTVSGASASTATPTLPVTPSRKTSRKFSFPGIGKDKSGNSSPTGSSRFASQQKREKRHSLLHKLKEIFSDKGKEKSEAKA